VALSAFLTTLYTFLVPMFYVIAASAYFVFGFAAILPFCEETTVKLLYQEASSSLLIYNCPQNPTIFRRILFSNANLWRFEYSGMFGHVG